MVTNLKELTAFVAKEGLVRLCTQDYQKPQKDNLHLLLGHLTNYSLNKLSENYVHTEDMTEEAAGSKQTLTQVLLSLEQEQQIDPSKLVKSIADVCAKTLLAF